MHLRTIRSQLEHNCASKCVHSVIVIDKKRIRWPNIYFFFIRISFENAILHRDIEKKNEKNSFVDDRRTLNRLVSYTKIIFTFRMLGKVALLILMHFLCADGQYTTWDAAQNAWCTNWQTTGKPDPVLTESCPQILVCLLIILAEFFESLFFIFSTIFK